MCHSILSSGVNLGKTTTVKLFSGMLYQEKTSLNIAAIDRSPNANKLPFSQSKTIARNNGESDIISAA
jgi:hypothetical protein